MIDLKPPLDSSNPFLRGPNSGFGFWVWALYVHLYLGLFDWENLGRGTLIPFSRLGKLWGISSRFDLNLVPPLSGVNFCFWEIFGEALLGLLPKVRGEIPPSDRFSWGKPWAPIPDRAPIFSPP